MKIAARGGQTGQYADFRCLRPGEYLRVTVDGVEIQHVYAVNTEAGEAHCYLKDATGHYVLTESRDDVVREVKHGVVRLFNKRTGEEVLK